MAFESDADRLALIQAVGEQFDTGKPTRMWAIFDRPSFDSNTGEFIAVKNRRPEMQCRESDVVAHELVKESRVVRESDGSVFFVKDFEPDGVGMVVVVLRK